MPFWKALLIVGLLVGLGIGSAQQLHLHNDNISGRLYLHALPTAISVLYHHHKLDYTALQQVADVFYAFGGYYPPDGINASITRAMAVQITDRSALYFWSADDRGLRDFVIAAFVLFGPSVKSFTFYYWTVFAVLALVSVIQHRDREAAHISALVVAGSILALPFLVFMTADFREPAMAAIPSDPVVNIYESRGFDLLALMPATALFLGAMAKNPPFLGYAIFDAVALALVVHTRSSAMQVMVLIIVALVPLAMIGCRRALSSTAIVVATIGLLWCYQLATFHPSYRSEHGNRTVWHNMIMGLHHTELGKRYGITIYDPSAVAAVVQWLKDRNDARADDPWVQKFVPGTFGYPGFDISAYERAAQDMIIDYATHAPLDIFRAALEKVLQVTAFYVRGLGDLLHVIWPAYLLVFVGALFLPVSRATCCRTALFLAAAVAFGVLPAIAFYFAPALILSAIAAFHALLLIAVASARHSTERTLSGLRPQLR